MIGAQLCSRRTSFKAGRFTEPQPSPDHHHQSSIVYPRKVVPMTPPLSIARLATFIARNLALPVKLFFILHLASEYVGTISPTTGPSMLPTAGVSGDVIFTSKRYARGNGIQFGDLVEYKHPMVPTESAMKRVMGLPGDFVREDGGLGRGDRMIQVVSSRRYTQIVIS